MYKDDKWKIRQTKTVTEQRHFQTNTRQKLNKLQTDKPQNQMEEN